MPPTPARVPISRWRRRKAPITLIALLGLAVGIQVLAPASAMAMIDQQVGTCSRIAGNTGWNYTTNEPCTLTQADGGGGSVAYGSGGGGEVIVIEGTAPSPCVRNPALCLSSDGRGTKGSRGDDNNYIGDGPRPGGGPAKNEVTKKPWTPEQCQKAQDEMDALLATIKKKNQEIDDANSGDPRAHSGVGQLRAKRANLAKEFKAGGCSVERDKPNQASKPEAVSKPPEQPKPSCAQLLQEGRDVVEEYRARKPSMLDEYQRLINKSHSIFKQARGQNCNPLPPRLGYP